LILARVSRCSMKAPVESPPPAAQRSAAFRIESVYVLIISTHTHTRPLPLHHPRDLPEKLNYSHFRLSEDHPTLLARDAPFGRAYSSTYLWPNSTRLKTAGEAKPIEASDQAGGA